MNNIAYFHIVFEDALQEAVITRLLKDAPCNNQIARRFFGHGSGFIKSRIQTFLQIARFFPVLILIDSDAEDCAIRFLDKLVPIHKRKTGCLIRIVVHEIESWLLADSTRLSRFLGISESLVPKSPESIKDAKKCLVDLARKSKREIAKAVVPKVGLSAKQGDGYNTVFSQFVEKVWDPFEASRHSESLRRAIMAIRSYSINR